MKIRITVGEKDKLNGYINIDPITKFDNVSVDIRDISCDLPNVEELSSAGLIDSSNVDTSVFGTSKFFKEKFITSRPGFLPGRMVPSSK